MVTNEDHALEEQVRRALQWDSRVEDDDLGVRAHDGIVTLHGTTSSYAKKLAAAEAAHRVPGVRDVADQVDVIVPGSRVRSDTEIARAVRATLEWNVHVPDERIRSTVSDGWVTLEGQVDRLRESDDAERAIADLEGVRGVINKIEIGGARIDPGELRQQIVDALARHARREASRIDVHVIGDAVTLSGTVDSWSEKRAVVGVTRHSPGVRTVHDTLQIDPYLARPPTPGSG